MPNENSALSLGRLNSNETFHYYDANSRYPNLIYGRVLIDRSIENDHARTAWKIANQRQPLAGCRIERVKGQLTWIRESVDKIDDRLFFETLTAPPSSREIPHRFRSPLPAGPLLLIRQWPVALSPQAEEYSSEIWLVSQHAVSDGAGAVAFINDWLQIYQNLCDASEPTFGLSKLDCQSLERRNQLGLCRWSFIKCIPFQIVGIFGAAKFLFRRIAKPNWPAPSRYHSPAAENLAVATAILSECVSASDLDSLTAAATSNNVSLNSVLIGNLFIALETWRNRVDPTADSSDWVRIILPMSLRDISHRRMPSANRTSIVQIDRRLLSEKQLNSVYQSIDHEINVIRRWQLDRMFLIIIRLLARSESLLTRVAQDSKSRGLAVFTNLGRPLRRRKRSHVVNPIEGVNEADIALLRNSQFDIKEFDFIGPLRAGTPFNLTAAKYDSQLRVSLHYDRSVVSTKHAREFLNEFLFRLSSTQSDVTSADNSA